MKNLTLLIVAMLLFLVCKPIKMDIKPNVIVILTDDQGSIDLNCYGSEDLATPNMDQIVESGIKFTQFYAAPVCSPSRQVCLPVKLLSVLAYRVM